MIDPLERLLADSVLPLRLDDGSEILVCSISPLNQPDKRRNPPGSPQVGLPEEIHVVRRWPERAEVSPRVCRYRLVRPTPGPSSG